MIKKDFKKRINSAVSVFVKTKDKLVGINEEMKACKSANEESIVELETENNVIDGLFSENEKIISNIDNILGK